VVKGGAGGKKNPANLLHGRGSPGHKETLHYGLYVKKKNVRPLRESGKRSELHH